MPKNSMRKGHVRETLIRMMLEQGGHSVKEIAEAAACTEPYVYSIRKRWALERQAQPAPAPAPAPIVEVFAPPAPAPKWFSDDWDPNWWQLLAAAVPAALLLYFIIVFVFSFHK